MNVPINDIYLYKKLSLTVVNFKLDFSKFFWATFNNESTFPVFVYAKMVSLSINPISGTFLFFFLFKNRGFMTLTQEKDYFFNIMYTHIYVEMALLYLTTLLVLCFMLLSFAFALYNPHLKALCTKHDN